MLSLLRPNLIEVSQENCNSACVTKQKTLRAIFFIYSYAISQTLVSVLVGYNGQRLYWLSFSVLGGCMH